MKNKNIFIDVEGKEIEKFEGGDLEITQSFVRFKSNDGKEIYLPWHRIRIIEITDKIEKSKQINSGYGRSYGWEKPLPLTDREGKDERS